MRGCGSRRLLLRPGHGHVHRALHVRKRYEQAEPVLVVVISYPIVNFGVFRVAFENDDTDEVAAGQVLSGKKTGLASRSFVPSTKNTL